MFKVQLTIELTLNKEKADGVKAMQRGYLPERLIPVAAQKMPP
jgi:hypothetical protein